MSTATAYPQVRYLSPTSLHSFEDDPTEFYRIYIAKGPREPQNAPMAVGSAFDAYVKAAIAERVFGKAHADSIHLGFTEVFESQVEPHNRTMALDDGASVMGVYVASGAFETLMTAIGSSEVFLDLKLQRTIGSEWATPDGTSYPGLVLHGRPDLYFMFGSVRVVLDWKVNGFYSKAAPSPAPGYISCFGPSGETGCHKNCVDGLLLGEVGADGASISMRHNVNMTIEKVKPDWGDQLVTYNWSLDSFVIRDDVPTDTFLLHSPCVYWIEQLLCSKVIPGKWRVARFRSLASPEFAISLYERYNNLWRFIHTGGIEMYSPSTATTPLPAGTDGSCTGGSCTGGMLASGREI